MTLTPLSTGLATDPKLLEHFEAMRTMVSKFAGEAGGRKDPVFRLCSIRGEQVEPRAVPHFEGAGLQRTAEFHCQQPETCNSKSSSNPSSTTDSKATNTTAKKNSYYNFRFTDIRDFTTTSNHDNSDSFRFQQQPGLLHTVTSGICTGRE